MKKCVWILCLLLCAQTGWAAATIKIGFMGPLSGDFAVVGKEAHQVLRLLTDGLNEQGGLLGRPVELVVEDDGQSPEKALAAGRRLAGQGAVAVIGSLKSAVTEPLQPIFNDRKIIHITYGSTAASLTEKGYPFFFRTCPQDEEQAKAAVQLIRRMKIRKVAILHDGSLYGTELAQRVQGRLLDWMIDVVFHETLKPGQMDYLPLLEKVRAATPDLVFFAGYYPEMARLLSGRRQMRWDATFMGTDASNHADLVKIAGKEAATGFLFLSPPVPKDLNSPKLKEFTDLFRKTHGYAPTSIHAILAGDAFIAMTESIRKRNTTDAAAIADHLHRHYFNPAGLTGTIYFNYRGDMVNDLHGVYRVDEEGRFILQKLIQRGQPVP